jgi:hypothetical protein
MSWLRNAKPIEHAQGYALVFGLFGYGLLFVAYSYVYSGLNLSIADLGLGYTDVLRNSAAALLLLVGTVLLLGLLLSMFPVVRAILGLGVFALLTALLSPSNWQQAPGEREILGFWEHTKDSISQPFVDRRAALAAGLPIEPVRFRGITIVDFQATRASVRLDRVSSTGPAVTTGQIRDCVLYLGQAQERLVVYDIQSGKVIRLPAAQMSITTPNGMCTGQASSGTRAPPTTAPKPKAAPKPAGPPIHTFVVEVKVDGNPYRVTHRGRSLADLRSRIEAAMRDGDVQSFSTGKQSSVTISFKGVRSVSLRVLRTLSARR